MILSIFPFLIFLVTLIGFLSLSGDSLTQQLIRVVPSDTGKSIQAILTEVTIHRSGALLSFGMLATLWSASNGVKAIIKGLNKAYDEEETRPFWKVRGIAVLATIVLAIVLIIAMVLLVFGEVIGQYVFRFLNVPTGFPALWNFLQWAVPVVAMFGVFLLLYRMTPDRKLTWREVVPGSAFTTLGWIASSGIMVMLIWLYWSSIIILLGGEINATVAFGKQGKQNRIVKKYGHVVPLFRNRSDVTRS